MKSCSIGNSCGDSGVSVIMTKGKFWSAVVVYAFKIQELICSIFEFLLSVICMWDPSCTTFVKDTDKTRYT